MKILLQSNIWQESAYDRLMQSIVDHSLEHRVVNIIPFTTEFDPPVDTAAFMPDVIFGSGRMVNICRQRGIPTFKSFAPIEPFYHERHWINAGGELVRWGDLRIDGPRFIKPVTEKFFTGTLVTCQEDLGKVQLATTFISNEADELVLVSDPINIHCEVRYYVIGGKVVTGSVYKEKGLPKQYEVFWDHPSWPALEALLDGRHIDVAYVIDLGLVEGAWRIVELNNLNSAGLYRCNTDAILSELAGAIEQGSRANGTTTDAPSLPCPS